VVILVAGVFRVDPLTLTAWQMLIGVLPLIGMAAARWTGPPDWTASLVAAVLFNIVLANVVGWVLWLLVLRSLPAGAAGLGTLAIPVVGVAAAWLQLGERPDPVEAVGMAAIVAALALLAALGARKA
jgi:drug/metabolite transporter (DMT)-like permease